MKKGMLFLTLLIVALWTTNAAACWLIFYKSGYKGRIIDAETNAPIKDAVVVAVYRSHGLFGWPGGASSSIINTRETLTDEKGEFYIYPYVTLINPLSYQYKTSFIIYKPGYQSYPIGYFGPHPEDFFWKISEKREKFAMEAKCIRLNMVL